MQQIDIITQAVLEKRESLIVQRQALDDQISELNKFLDHQTMIDKVKDSSSSVDIVATSLTGKVLHVIGSKRYVVTNRDIVGATGATGPQVSSTLYRLKEAKKIDSIGDNKKAIEWGLMDWFDENGNLKDEYKQK